MIIGFRVQGSRFKVMVAASPRIYMGDTRRSYSSHKSQVTSHASLLSTFRALVTASPHQFSLPLEGKVPRRGG